MFTPTTCADTRNAIFSPASASGVMPCVSPDGRTIARSGQDHAHTNLSAQQAKVLGLLTSGTSGPRSTISSASAALQQFLESRLRAKTALLGSTLYRMTWQVRVTPAGRSIPALRASVPRTSDSACIGWPSPLSNSANGAGTSGREGGLNLQTAVSLTGWATPMANDAKGSTHCYGPKKPDGTRVEYLKLPGQVKLTGPTRLTATGKLLTGLHAGMSAGGQLNPAHARWLMGLPPEWDDCAVTATPSLRRKHKRLSKP